MAEEAARKAEEARRALEEVKKHSHAGSSVYQEESVQPTKQTTASGSGDYVLPVGVEQ